MSKQIHMTDVLKSMTGLKVWLPMPWHCRSDVHLQLMMALESQ